MARTRKVKHTCGKTMKRKTGCGEVSVTINKKEINSYQALIKGDKAKSGGCMASHLESISKVLGIALKYSKDPKKTLERIVYHLKDIRCSKPIEESSSCPDCIAKIIEDYLKKEKEK